MSDYYPDRWVELEFYKAGEFSCKKILAGWYGGYLGTNSWKLNSGVESEVEDDQTISFKGYSGSVYHCDKLNWGLSGYTSMILNGWLAETEGTDIEIRLIERNKL